MNSLALACILLLTASAGHYANAAQLSIQLSDAKGAPIRGAQITLNGRATLALTDIAGKATIDYEPNAAPMGFKIVRPAGLVVVSPWQGTTSVPPNVQTIVVATRAQMNQLTDPPVVKAAVARVNDLQRPRSVTASPETGNSRAFYLKRASDELGIDPARLDQVLQNLDKSTNAPYERGMANLYQRDYEHAVSQLTDALQAAQQHTPQNPREISNAALFLGHAQYSRGRFPAAAAAYLTASQARPGDPIILNNLGISLSRAGRYAEAKSVYQRALEILRGQPAADPLDIQTTNGNLAALYVYSGDLAAAEPILRRALNVSESLSPNDPAVANALNNLAAILLVQRQCPEARPLLEKAVQIQRGATPAQDQFPNSKGLVVLENEIDPHRPLPRGMVVQSGGMGASTPGLNTTMLNLSSLLLCEGKPDKARDLLEETIERQKAQLGQNHPDLATSLNVLAEAQVQLGNQPGAVASLKEALELQRIRLGVSHPAVASTAIHLADVLVVSGSVSEALIVYGQAQTILVQTFGADSIPVQRLREKVAKAQTSQP